MQNMRVIILNPTLLGGVWYNPKPTPQTVPVENGRHLVQMGAAREYVTKEQEPAETKKGLSVSPAGQASQNPTPRRRGRPKGGKSTSSTTITD